MARRRGTYAFPRLHYLVRLTRYACVAPPYNLDKKFSPISKQVFTLLHRRYPNSKWTKQTPYYF